MIAKKKDEKYNAYEIYQDKIFNLVYNYDTDIYELHITPIK